jgi:hypothetical protein
MLRTCLLLAFTALSICARSQKQSITWGDEFKLKKGSSSIQVLTTDVSGVYIQENHWALKSYYVIGSSVRASASLVKLDKNLQEVYRSDFNKELRGKEFEGFFAFKDKLLIIASEYHKSDRALEVFAAEVDKSSGELVESFKPITSFQKEEKKEEINFKLIPNADTSKFVVISTITGKERNTYQVQEFDKKLKASAKPAAISNEFEAKTYQLEDVLYTTDRKIILVGRVFEYQEGKKKKEKFLDFANYNIRIYDEKGKQLNEINTNINGKWLSNTKVLVKGKELVLACFYSREKKGATNGLLVQRIDPGTGQVISTAEKEINYSLLTADTEEADDDKADDKESRQERKEREKLSKIKDEGEGFSKYMMFRNLFYTSDDGMVLLAERYHQYAYTSSSYMPGTNGMPGTWQYYTNYVYESGELMMVKIDAVNSISWLQVVPKSQREVYRSSDGGNGAGVNFSLSFSFFDLGTRPYYGGFGAIQTKDKINIFFNDSPRNGAVMQPGQKVRTISSFRNSECFNITLDEVTGKYQRKVFFSNADVPTAMPRHGSMIGQDMYIVGKTDRLFGKSKIAVGKITSK